MLKILKSTLCAADERRLKSIWEPVVVGVQPEDSRRGLVVMPDGELRSWGIAGKSSVFGNDGRQVYLSSRNCGLDWKLCYPEHERVLGEATRLPWSGRWIAVSSFGRGERAGTYAMLSDIGPDDPEPRYVKLSDRIYIDMFLPEIYEDEHRVTVCGHCRKSDGYDAPTFMYSDDDGESWTLRELKSTPKHEAVWPHLGVRWQNTGTECTYTRLADGRLMLLARTSLDFLYVYYSSDLGESWTDGEPSQFHCTLTTPYLLKLHDGRTILFWNNTRPLAERNHELEYPPLSNGAKSGAGEDVFTNRDANHAAISDDCVDWIGFRELALNEIRNEPDFRVKGGIASSADKSVHQFQAIELPFNKVLVEYGQHEISRRIAIFDIGWLYEKERHEDWQQGMKNISTQMYVRSISDCHLGSGYSGHCAWNRTNGSLLVPDPDITWGEALQICRVHDRRLVSELQGAVWNFPMSRRGSISLRIRVRGAGIRVRLCDHWMNPTDEYAGLYAIYDFELDRRILPLDKWYEVVIDFEQDVGSVSADGTLLFRIASKAPAPQGISYLHMQTMAEGEDFDGTLIGRIDYRGV